MLWFEGTIPEAIQRSKSAQSLFVVFVYDEDSNSAKLTQSFDDEEVSRAFHEASCVAIKLSVKSETGRQFSQIYPVVLVPSVFFIGKNGIPLEISGGYLSPAELIEKLNNALKLHHSAAESGVAPSTQQDSVPSSSDSSQLPSGAHNRDAQSSATESGGYATSSADSRLSEAYSSQQVVDDEHDSGLSERSSADSLEKRKAHALQLLAKKREEKAQLQEEMERKQEIERRKLGQEMVKLKQSKDDREKKEFENSYKKQKEEERLAREKVRAEIERDRQERALKYNQMKSDREAALARQEAEKMAAKAEADAKLNAAKMESARIQFRLPDGSTVTNVFPSSDTLSTAKAFIMQKMAGTFKDVTLSTIYPRKTFTDSDMRTPLLQLDLAPSGIVVVLPKISEAKNSSVAGIFVPLLWLWAQLMALWTVIYNLLFASPVPKPQQSTNVPTSGRDNVRPQQSEPSDSRLRRRLPRSDGTKRRVEGNVHRLTADDSDDEAATWNGNSTQQM